MSALLFSTVCVCTLLHKCASLQFAGTTWDSLYPLYLLTVPVHASEQLQRLENKCSNVLLLSGMWESYNDEETSALRGVVSGQCRCAACQQRRSSGMLTVRSGSVVLLPGDDAGWSSYLQTYVDRDSLHYLTEKRVINWCSSTYKLYPMKTTGSVTFFQTLYITVVRRNMS